MRAAPADDDKCPCFCEDNTTLVILVVIALLFGGDGAAVIGIVRKPPQPSCRSRGFPRCCYYARCL